MDASAVLVEAPVVASLCSGMLSERCIRRAVVRRPEKVDGSPLSSSMLLLLFLLLYLVLDCGWRVAVMLVPVWHIGIQNRASILCLFASRDDADEQN